MRLLNRCMCVHDVCVEFGVSTSSVSLSNASIVAFLFNGSSSLGPNIFGKYLAHFRSSYNIIDL